MGCIVGYVAEEEESPEVLLDTSREEEWMWVGIFGSMDFNDL